MVVRVPDIPTEGLSITDAGALGAVYRDPTWRLLDVSLQLERDGADVFVTGQVRAAVSQACGRCLEPSPAEVTADLDVRLVPRPATADNVELAADDLDVDFYDRDEIDIGALIEAETTLALPMKPLCREAVLGSAGFAAGTGMWSSASAESARSIHGWLPSKTWPRGFPTRRLRCLCRNDATRRRADASAALTTSWWLRRARCARSAVSRSCRTGFARTVGTTRGGRSWRSKGPSRLIRPPTTCR